MGQQILHTFSKKKANNHPSKHLTKQTHHAHKQQSTNPAEVDVTARVGRYSSTAQFRSANPLLKTFTTRSCADRHTTDIAAEKVGNFPAVTPSTVPWCRRDMRALTCAMARVRIPHSRAHRQRTTCWCQRRGDGEGEGEGEGEGGRI